MYVSLPVRVGRQAIAQLIELGLLEAERCEDVEAVAAALLGLIEKSAATPAPDDGAQAEALALADLERWLNGGWTAGLRC
jgi:hypothetical protein